MDFFVIYSELIALVMVICPQSKYIQEHKRSEKSELNRFIAKSHYVEGVGLLRLGWRRFADARGGPKRAQRRRANREVASHATILVKETPHVGLWFQSNLTSKQLY